MKYVVAILLFFAGFAAAKWVFPAKPDNVMVTPAFLDETNQSLILSTTAIENANDRLLVFIGNELQEPYAAQIAKFNYPKAEIANALSNEAANLVKKIKDSVEIKISANSNPATSNRRVQDYFIKEHRGLYLYNLLNELSKQILSIDEKIDSNLHSILKVKLDIRGPNNNKNEKQWISENFEDKNAAIVLTNLNRILNEIAVSKNQVLGYIYSRVAREPVIYDK
jgi:hypothetical protein